MEDVKNEQRDQRKMLVSVRTSALSSGERRHPVFEQDVTMPLRKVEEFNTFEENLSNPEIRNNLVTIRILRKMMLIVSNLPTLLDSCNSCVWRL